MSCLVLLSTNVWAQDELARRASWQAKVSFSEPVGVKVTELETGTPLFSTGVKVDDRILAVNGVAIKTRQAWQDLTDALVADKDYELVLRRDEKRLTVTTRFPAVERETYPGIAVEYDEIVSDYGIRQRTIITRPEAAVGPIPGIVVLQGLSCSSIEYTPGRRSNFIRSLRGLVQQSGMAVMRIEKPGLGDSEGDCSRTDFHTELNGYQVAIEQFKARDDVDAGRIVVYGSSMGSALAPYLVEQHQLNGVIADGTFFRSWFEHMLEIERRIKRMQGKSQSEINTLMTQVYIPLYYGMLVEQRSYADLVRANPLLAEHNYHADAHMYGRPVAYYHQVQAFNFAGAWSQVKVPVRIRYGSNDWIMSEADNHMIVDALKRAGNQNVELFVYPGLDHWDTVHKTPDDSFHGQPGQWQDMISEQIVGWAQELNARARR